MSAGIPFLIYLASYANPKDPSYQGQMSVDYWASSKRATRFRQWATRTLKQHLVDGYTLNQRSLRDQLKAIQAQRLGVQT